MLITVRDLLQEKGDTVWSVSPDTPIIDVIKTMAAKQIGDLLVLENGLIAGIVSERDIVGKSPKQQPANWMNLSVPS